MTITAMISKVSRELSLRINKLQNQPKKLRTLISQPQNQQQPWQRGFATALVESVKVSSREMIFPTSATPPHNTTVYFSLIDQISANSYIPILLFYQNDPSNPSNIDEKTKLLKKALSQTLVNFYPLAGRIKQNELIECSDEGAEFCVAHPSNNLLQFIENPSFRELEALLPFQGTPDRHKNILLSVQVNHFSCGGMAIGVCLSHKIADGAAVVAFLQAWASKSQNSDHYISNPIFNGASLFPPIKELNNTSLVAEIQGALVSNEKIALRRQIFDKKALDELKAQATIHGPTRVEVVTAFLCQHWPSKVSSILQVVNLRKRMVPPVSDDFFGNCAWFARTSPLINPSEYPVRVIDELRKAIKNISGNYMSEFLCSDNFVMQLVKETSELCESPEEMMVCNSMSRFGLYDVNFGIGMGTPIWACVATAPINNAVLAMSTKCGHGIEAWIRMHEDDLAKLDSSFSHLGYPIIKPMKLT